MIKVVDQAARRRASSKGTLSKTINSTIDNKSRVLSLDNVDAASASFGFNKPIITNFVRVNPTKRSVKLVIKKRIAFCNLQYFIYVIFVVIVAISLAKKRSETSRANK